MGDNIDWAKIFLIAFGTSFLVCLILLLALFGWVVFYILLMLILVCIIVVLSAFLLRSLQIIRTTEAGLQEVLDDISSLGSEFDQQMKRMVWPEDEPQFRKMSSIMFRAKVALLNAPITINNSINRTLPQIPGETDQKLDIDEEWMNQLYEKVDTDVNE